MSIKRINCPLSILLWAVNLIESWLQWCLAWMKKLSILKINTNASWIQFRSFKCMQGTNVRCRYLRIWNYLTILYVCVLCFIQGTRQFNYVFTLLQRCFHHSVTLQWYRGVTTGGPGCITCANFILGEGREPKQWSYSDGCSDSDVVTLPWPLISLLGFISNQFVMNIIRWHWHEIRDVLHLLHGWVLH